jgi:hypothetical protein
MRASGGGANNKTAANIKAFLRTSQDSAAHTKLSIDGNSDKWDLKIDIGIS